MGGRSGCLCYKLLIGAIAMLGFVWFFLMGTLHSEATKTATSTIRPIGNFKREEVMGRQKLFNNPEFDHHFMMSKRRVPNGSDPVHNRRTGNSRQPPGRA